MIRNIIKDKRQGGGIATKCHLRRYSRITMQICLFNYKNISNYDLELSSTENISFETIMVIAGVG